MLTTLIERDNVTRAIAFARGRTDLHVMPTAAGVEHRTQPDYSWDGMKRGGAAFIVLQHTLSGIGRLDYEGRRHVLLPGSTMIVSIPHAHRYYVAAGDSWRFFYLVIAGRETRYLADEIQRAAGPVLHLPEGPIDRLAEICLGLIDHDQLGPGAASALGYEAMMLLLDHTATISSGSGDSWVAPVLAHIASHLDTALPVEDMAERAHMSRAHFVRQFTRQVGSAPSEYIFRQRMEKAARLLELTGAPVGDIALRCGFANANYFAKAFRRAFDVSPTEFRASGMYRTRPPEDEEN